MTCQRCQDEASVHLTETVDGRAARAPPLRRPAPEGRAGPARVAAQAGARRRRPGPDRGPRRRAGRRAGRADLPRLRHEVHGVPGRRPARLPARLPGLRRGPAPPGPARPRRDPARRQGRPGGGRPPASGSGSAPGSARRSPAKITSRPRGSATSSAPRTPTHEPGRPDPNLRRVAPRHRPRERHRHVLADPPGAQPRRLPLHQPRQPRREGRDRGPRPGRHRRTPSSSWPTSTSTACRTLDRQFLVERQLISRELANGEGPRGVAIGPHENVSIMVNEEDHLRIQVMLSGLSLHDVWERINRLDDQLEEQLAYAYSPQLGYLTACPTNVGTGIRVGVMLHLPALVQTKQIDKVFRALQKINLAVRGLYGEGTPGLRRLLPDLQPADPRQERAGADPDPHRRRPPGHPVRADGPPGPRERAPAAPPRPGQPRLRRPQDGPHDLQRGDDAPALERPDGDQPRPDRRPGDRHGQRAVHPDPAGLPPEDPGAPSSGVEERNVARASYLRSRLSNGRQAPGIERLRRLAAAPVGGRASILQDP